MPHEVVAVNHLHRPVVGRLAAVATVITLLVLTIAAPVSAKEGMEAALQTPIRLDTPPGTELTVRWSVFVDTDDGRVAVSEMPVFLRLLAPGAAKDAQVLGVETPKGSGEYIATITVPAGGIAGVEVGLQNVTCLNGGTCSDTDMLFDLTDDSLVSGAAVAPAPRPNDTKPVVTVPNPVTVPQPALATAATTTTAPATADATGLPSWLPGAGLAMAVLAAIAAVAARRIVRSRRARRVATSMAATLAVIVVTLVLASAVSAKEPAVSTLDEGVATGAAAGTTIEVGWTMTVMTGDGVGPYLADPMSLQVVAKDGQLTSVPATQDREGHYVATVVVPASGIGALRATLPSDGPAPLGFDLYGSAPVVQTAGDPTVSQPAPATAAAPAQATAPAPAPVVTTPATATTTQGPAPIALLVLALVAAFALGALVVGFVRRQPTRDAGRTIPG
jgi:hypothetical protein